MKRKTSSFLIVTVVILVFVEILLLAVCAMVFMRTAPLFEAKIVEVGTKISNSPEDYIEGTDWILKKAVLDISDVDEDRVGKYQATCKVLFKEYTYIIYVIEPAFEGKVIELGSEISQKASDYLRGNRAALKHARIDVSGVDGNRVGEYEAYSYIEDYEFQYVIRVVDTVAPEINFFEDDFYLETDKIYRTKDFVESTFDYSDEVTVCFEVDGMLTETLSFDETGPHTLVFYAEDAYENSTRTELVKQVDIAPFIGAWDAYISVGEQYDPLENIFAYDNLEGDITERITVNTDDINVGRAGQYMVQYEVSDNNGLHTRKNINVNVCEESELRRYEYLEGRSLAQEEIRRLRQCGYFQYEPLEEDNREQAIELVKPTSVHILTPQGIGSGFISDITPEYIYIATVDHVANGDEGCSCEFTFFDDSIVKSKYDRVKKENTDLALIKFDISSIPRKVLLGLKWAYVDEAVYEECYRGQSVIEYCENWRAEKERKIYDTILREVYSDSTAGTSGWVDCSSSMDGKAKTGMSGCPVIDYRGRVIGTLSYKLNGRDYTMRIDELDTLREEIDAE